MSAQYFCDCCGEQIYSIDEYDPSAELLCDTCGLAALAEALRSDGDPANDELVEELDAHLEGR